MLSGTSSSITVPEESACRTTKEYRFTDVGMYQIHSTTLMPNIPFEESAETPEPLDATIFLNDGETKLTFPNNVTCQNYLTTRYIGRAPLDFYSGEDQTQTGQEFVLKCIDGNPSLERYRVFGTEDAIRGVNKNASDMSSLPGGGEEFSDG